MFFLKLNDAELNISSYKIFNKIFLIMIFFIYNALNILGELSEGLGENLMYNMDLSPVYRYWFNYFDDTYINTILLMILLILLSIYFFFFFRKQKYGKKIFAKLSVLILFFLGTIYLQSLIKEAFLNY